jgi:hypothetical protein
VIGFRHDPYSLSGHAVVGLGPLVLSNDFEHNLHCALESKVNFRPYPSVPFYRNVAPHANLHRLFVGQLPHDITAMQLEWIVHEVTNCPIFDSECIVKWPDRMPKGCVHTYCFPEHRDRIVRALHRRVLIDECGIWYAENDAESEELQRYCMEMKRDKTKRFPNRPNQPMVVEDSKSTFVPRRAP